MIIKVDTENQKILHNGKVINIDLWNALKMAPADAMIEVIEELDENGVVTVKLHMPKQ